MTDSAPTLTIEEITKELHDRAATDTDCRKILWLWAKTLDEKSSLLSERDRLSEALKKITRVSQFDHAKNNTIISSEEYEGAWLDCIEIAEEALTPKGKKA